MNFLLKYSDFNKNKLKCYFEAELQNVNNLLQRAEIRT
jgi:hypothetical protein